MLGWFLIETFYHGLKRMSREHLDATTRGLFFSLQVPAAKELIEKMVANQGWDGDRRQPHTRSVPLHEEIGGIKQHGNRQDYGRTHDVRSLRQCGTSKKRLSQNKGRS
jgi:hypothetical protein